MLRRFLTLLVVALVTLASFPGLAGVNQVWLDRWDGQGHQWDIPYGITTDSEGHVYVIGASKELIWNHPDYSTIKYDSTGNVIWQVYWDGPTPSCDSPYDIVLDDAGNVFVAGASDPYDSTDTQTLRCDDFAIVKYDVDGNQQWLYRYEGDYCDLPNAIALDAAGYIYAAGYTETATTSKDMFLVKLDADGDSVWTRSYNGPGNVHDWIWDMVIDDAGDIYVTGGSYGVGSFLDCVTMKYDSDGNLAWEHRYNGSGNELDEGLQLALDGLGNLYVAGYSYGAGTLKDVLLIKFDTTGTELWTRTFDGAASGLDQASALAVDAAGNAYLCGGTTNPGTGLDFLAMKYQPNGDTAWVRTYDGPHSGADQALDLALGADGSAYLTGSSGVSGIDFDFATLKYDSNGNLTGVRLYEGIEGGIDQATQIAVGANGTVYVSGESDSDANESDFVTIGYKFFEGTCGDADGNGIVNVSDAVYLIAYVFGGGPPPESVYLGDADCNGILNISDGVWLIGFIFAGGLPPCSAC